MQQGEFQRAVALFSEAFPKLEFNPKLWWPVVADLDGECFIFSVGEVVKTVKEFYPGSNPLAVLIEKHDELVSERRKFQQKKLAKETDLERMDRWKSEAVPMPAECREYLQKKGLLK